MSSFNTLSSFYMRFLSYTDLYVPCSTAAHTSQAFYFFEFLSNATSVISIHAPRVGSDAAAEAVKNLRNDFNLSSPRG